MTINVLVADDHELVRIGLRTLFTGTEIHIVAEASDGNSAFALAKKHRPQVALLDVRMPEADGLRCLVRIKLDLPETIVLMLSGFDNPTYIARAVGLGAAGYLSKSAHPSQIIDAIRAAVGGDTIWSQEQLRRVSGALAAPHLEKEGEVPLTPRESEVLKQVALGLTNKEIAKMLHISYETVKEHVGHILQKLGVGDRTQAAVWAVRRNLV
ncbi:MAG TPA: response regulator transcription factor [Lacipirellulaceae bacterium]|jgi:DNA-binding NarL/FixJ family response regulator|nr:response regulator transcription factor [Lacipirellulaceae bacterium]